MNLCSGRTTTFFSEAGPEIFVAKRLCARCDRQPGCLRLGMALAQWTGHLNGTGIYGGFTERERLAMKGRQP